MTNVLTCLLVCLSVLHTDTQVLFNIQGIIYRGNKSDLSMSYSTAYLSISQTPTWTDNFTPTRVENCTESNTHTHTEDHKREGLELFCNC